MREIYYIDRKTKEKKKEAIYGEKALLFLYESKWYLKIFSIIAALLLCRFHFFSRLYGQIQKMSFTKKKVRPFIQKFDINENEFLKSNFSSFNDFFTRELALGARPIDSKKETAVLPADARYLAYQNFDDVKKVFVKGRKFSLEEFLKDEYLAKKYLKGSIVIARLCPVDYHRFHFPIDCIPNKAKCINGMLHSVNPIALWKNISYLSENKRVVTLLKSELFGDVVFVEVGAVNVGSIHQTYTPCKHHPKGQEKGFFSFGGSCVVLLFEKNKIQIDADLLSASDKKIETYAEMGQSLGVAKF